MGSLTVLSRGTSKFLKEMLLELQQELREELAQNPPHLTENAVEIQEYLRKTEQALNELGA